MTTTPTSEPLSLVAGDSVAWTKTLSDYPATDSWVLSYVLLAAGKTPIVLSSTASQADHAVSKTAAETAAWAAGTYRWTAMVTKAGERKTIGSGTVEILPNPATQDSSHDPRTHAEKCLAAIEAVLEGRMSDPIIEYQIAGRMAKKIPHGDLLKLRIHYQAEVRRQKGVPRAIAIPVRFGRG